MHIIRLCRMKYVACNAGRESHHTTHNQLSGQSYQTTRASSRANSEMLWERENARCAPETPPRNAHVSCATAAHLWTLSISSKSGFSLQRILWQNMASNNFEDGLFLFSAIGNWIVIGNGYRNNLHNLSPPERVWWEWAENIMKISERCIARFGTVSN